MKQLSTNSTASSGDARMRRHPTILPTQPDSRFKWCRSETAPATHQDQGDEDLRTRSSAPGTVRRPRKPSSLAGRVHKLGMSRALGYPEGRHHLLAHGRRAQRQSFVCAAQRYLTPGTARIATSLLFEFRSMPQYSANFGARSDDSDDLQMKSSKSSDHL